ncbi:MAG: hypothetical protein H6596_07130 [Flavobacteriales bacterium]|nr:hypothetical protein [Flavobacteriales bacterium]
MANQKTIKERIADYCLKELAKNPEGLRFSELKRLVAKRFPNVAKGTIHGSVYNLSSHELIIKPSRGLFQLSTAPKAITKKKSAKGTRHTEQSFYQPFAEWITDELEECTKAVPLGGKKFKDKWGTPDVIGVKAPKKSDILVFPIEVVSAEIKVDSNNLITAFGQACSYRLFSHKSYIVVPEQSSKDDLDRLDGLSVLFGIGLILFDNTNPKDPNFQIRCRAARNDPDMYYTNKYMKLVEDDLFE